MNRLARNPRKLALDKPCRFCGKPIHHTYVGPVEGVCGRCVDRGRGTAKRRPQQRRGYHYGVVVDRPRASHRSMARTAVLMTIVIVGGTAGGIWILRHLFG